jgi:hypothetical protein
MNAWVWQLTHVSLAAEQKTKLHPLPNQFDSTAEVQQPKRDITTCQHPTLSSRTTSVNDRYMTKQQLAQPRKRQRTEQHSSPSKRQKRSHNSSERQTLDEFWDGLSKIWLTKHALKELDRRNAKRLRHLLPQRAHQPVTRKLLAKVKKRHTRIHLVRDFLHNYTLKGSKNIKVYARHGGPDLSDLRGVRIMRTSRCQS